METRISTSTRARVGMRLGVWLLLEDGAVGAASKHMPALHLQVKRRVKQLVVTEYATSLSYKPAYRRHTVHLC